MERYSKSYSNFTKKRYHQKTDNGTIFERDWGTLGERHVIEQGKRRVYSDSNFLFTDSTILGSKYRNNTGEWSEAYTQEKLDKKIDPTVNDTSILDDSNDIRDYAYYGSAVDLLRSTVDNIIKWFPGRFWSTDDTIYRPNTAGDGWIYIRKIITDGHHNYVVKYTDDPSKCEIHTIRNPFEIDFYHSNVVLTKYDNTLRYMPLSWTQYLINGAPLKTWDVWIKPYSECDENYTIKYDIRFTFDPDECVTFRNYEEEDWCCVQFKDQKSLEEDDCISFGCVGDCESEQIGHIYGIMIDRELVWCCDVSNFAIQPKQEIIDKYFLGLKGFEAKLLDRRNNPKYTSKFITPIPYKNNDPHYSYVERSYTWPHSGYCLSIDTIGFENYFNSLYTMASTMDELWCDNLWKNMTHESIKNFDWTYTKQYEEGEEIDNILGGTRMEGILKCWGRAFDDIKRYIDGISLKNCVTYDDSMNLGNAEMSDRAELLGWEAFSTKLANDKNEYLTNKFVDNLQKLENRWGPDATVEHDKWYYSKTPNSVSQNTVDNDFMRNLVLSSGEIMRSKGTKQSIEMVFALFGIGDDEIEIKERYFTVQPKNRNDLFCFYRPNFDPHDTERYLDISEEYSTINEYIEANPPQMTSEPYVFVDDKYYDLIYDMTVGDFCEYMTYTKSARLNYEYDEFSGYPIRDVYLNNKHYIVPYFTQDQIYDGNVQFETKGGWGKSTEEVYDEETIKAQEFDYLETIPYMETIQTVGDLLKVNAFQIGKKRIFYVVDLTDLSTYDNNYPKTVSHFFKLVDPNNPSSFSSWKNIPSDGVIDPNYEIFNGITDEDIKLAQYNDDLKFNNIGNNPHCGYATYDLGSEYLDYIREPFKYPAENYGFPTLEDIAIASQFTFDVTEVEGEKMVNLTNEYKYDYMIAEGVTLYKEGEEDNVYVEVTVSQVTDGVVYYKEITTDVFVEAVEGTDYWKAEPTPYVVPSKFLTIKNNIDNELYKEYLREIILKYVLQVVPSTTILLLENFKKKEEEQG